MGDNFDVLIRFLTSYEGKGAQQAIADLNAVNQAQGGTTAKSTDTTAASLQNLRTQVQGVSTDTKVVVDQFQQLRDLGSTMGAGGEKVIIPPVDSASWERFNQITGQTVDQLQSLRQTGGEFKGFTDATEFANQSLDELNARFEKFGLTGQDAGEKAAKGLNVMAETYPHAAAEIDALNEAFQRSPALIEKQQRAAVQSAISQQWEYRRLQYAGRAMTEIAQTFFVPSVAVLTGAVAWAQNYVKNATTANQITRDWKSTTDSLTYSQSRVGAVLAEVELPALQEMARLSNAAAGFIEKNPDLVKGVLTGAGVVAAISGMALLAAKGIRLYADVGYITATNEFFAAQAGFGISVHEFTAAVAANKGIPTAIPVGGTAAAVGGASLISVLSTLLAVVGGIVAGGAIYNAIKPTGAPTAQQTAAMAGVLSSEGAYQLILKHLGKFGEGINDVNKIINSVVLGWTGIKVNWGAGAGAGAIPAVPFEQKSWFQDALKAWQDYSTQVTSATTSYNKQRLSIEINYEKQRTETVANYAKQRAQSEASYQLGVSRSWRDYLQNEGDIERKYYADRTRAAADTAEELLRAQQDNQLRLQQALEANATAMQGSLEQRNAQALIKEYQLNASLLAAAAEYGTAALRAEEDHQIEMARDLEDHENRQKDLLETRDGLAMIREDEQYELARKRKEEDYLLASERRDTDAAIAARDREIQFAEERAQRARDFQQKMADNAVDHDTEMAQAAANEADTLAKQQADYNDQEKALADSYHEQLSTLERSFRDRLNTIDQAILGDYAAVQATVAKMTADFRAWLITMGSSLFTNVPVPAKDSGGPMYPGKTYINTSGKLEWALNPADTARMISGGGSAYRFAEQSIGGQLFQDRVLAAMLNMNNRSNQYLDNRILKFYNVPEELREAIRRDVHTITLEAVKEAMES